MPPHSLLPHRPGMNNFTAALASIRRVKSEGVVKDYAIGGAENRCNSSRHTTRWRKSDRHGR